MKPLFKGLIAAFAAIALMTAWAAFAADGDAEETATRNIEAVVFQNKKDGGELKDVKKASVPVEVLPLSGQGKCTNRNKQEYEATMVDGEKAYVLQTSGSAGNDYGISYLSNCVRGMYQVSIRIPTGFKMNATTEEHQIIKVEQNKTKRVEFIIEQP